LTYRANKPVLLSQGPWWFWPNSRSIERLFLCLKAGLDWLLPECEQSV